MGGPSPSHGAGQTGQLLFGQSLVWRHVSAKRKQTKIRGRHQVSYVFATFTSTGEASIAVAGFVALLGFETGPSYKRIFAFLGLGVELKIVHRPEDVVPR